MMDSADSGGRPSGLPGIPGHYSPDPVNGEPRSSHRSFESEARLSDDDVHEAAREDEDGHCPDPPPVVGVAAPATDCLCQEQAEDGFRAPPPPPESDWMIACDVCHVWFHGDCVSLAKVAAATLDKFHCPRCRPLCGPSILRPFTNAHRYDPCQADAEQLPVGTKDFVTNLLRKTSFPHLVEGSVSRRPDGRNITLEDLVSEPLLVERTHGLDLTVPSVLHSETEAIQSLQDSLGADRRVDVIDSFKQGSFPLDLGELCKCFASDDPSDAVQPLNCLSLEISDSSLGQAVQPPGIVRQACWVNRYWENQPPNSPWISMMRPKVQKYFILSMSNAYTDFHVDFGGSSVWYHVISGKKTFYLIDPTKENIEIYERWHKMPNQSEIFLLDLLPTHSSYKKVEIYKHQTLFIPSGWIHAVLTEDKAMVLGGNYLHDLNMPMQLQIQDVEARLQIPVKFRYPRFHNLHWLVAWTWNQQLKEDKELSSQSKSTLLARARHLLKYLKLWLSKLKDSEDTTRKAKSALVKDLNRTLKQMDKPKKSHNLASSGYSESREPVLPKIKLTLTPRSTFDLTDRNNVRHLMQNPVAMNSPAATTMPVELPSSPVKTVASSLESELNDAMAEFQEGYEDGSGRRDGDGDPANDGGRLLINLKKKSTTGRSKRPTRNRGLVGTSEFIRQVYQDDDFVYPALDFSDEEDMEEMKRQEKKRDSNWKPKAKIKNLTRKVNRPCREGTARIEVQRGLREVALKKPKSKGGNKLVLNEAKVVENSTAALISHSPLPTEIASAGAAPSKTKVKVKRLLPEKQLQPSQVAAKMKRPKGMATAKQRLGKLLKLKF